MTVAHILAQKGRDVTTVPASRDRPRRRRGPGRQAHRGDRGRRRRRSDARDRLRAGRGPGIGQPRVRRARRRRLRHHDQGCRQRRRRRRYPPASSARMSRGPLPPHAGRGRRPDRGDHLHRRRPSSTGWSRWSRSNRPCASTLPRREARGQRRRSLAQARRDVWHGAPRHDAAVCDQFGGAVELEQADARRARVEHDIRGIDREAGARDALLRDRERADHDAGDAGRAVRPALEQAAPGKQQAAASSCVGPARGPRPFPRQCRRRWRRVRQARHPRSRRGAPRRPAATPVRFTGDHQIGAEGAADRHPGTGFDIAPSNSQRRSIKQPVRRCRAARRRRAPPRRHRRSRCRPPARSRVRSRRRRTVWKGPRCAVRPVRGRADAAAWRRHDEGGAAERKVHHGEDAAAVEAARERLQRVEPSGTMAGPDHRLRSRYRATTSMARPCAVSSRMSADMGPAERRAAAEGEPDAPPRRLRDRRRRGGRDVMHARSGRRAAPRGACAT